jgi:peptidoglycan/LPS O-acetylase OafA/YrhL
MAWVLLILVLLAAAFGVLGAVLKAVVFLVLTVVLTVVVVSMLAWWMVKRQTNRFLRDFDLRTGRIRGGRSSRDRARTDPELPRTHDDRY